MSSIRVLVIPSLILAAWVAFDSRRIRIVEYHSSLSYRPLTLFLIAAAAPVIVVPWYLTARDLIKSGLTPRRGSAASPV